MKGNVLFLILCLSLSSSAQENVSMTTGVSLLHNFSPHQSFTTVGVTVQANVHFTAQQSAYAWVDFYSGAKFTNAFVAAAKSSLLTPQQLHFLATGHLTFRQFSLGWKHYFKGGYENDASVNVYGTAGFGFLFAAATNEFSTAIDTTQYSVATVSGEGTVRKLTFDLGMGIERAVNSNMFLFTDLRTWLPASSSPSPYLHNQKNMPLPLMLSAGVRVLIGSASQ